MLPRSNNVKSFYKYTDGKIKTKRGVHCVKIVVASLSLATLQEQNCLQKALSEMTIMMTFLNAEQS